VERGEHGIIDRRKACDGRLKPLSRSSRVASYFLVAFSLYVVLVHAAGTNYASRELSNYFAYHQDLVVAPIVLAFLLLIVFVRIKTPIDLPIPNRLAILAVSVTVFALCYGGAFVVFHRFDLSMDEVMADFDMRIIREGHLFAPLAPQWRDLRDALQPIFLLQVPGAQVWSSSYLPGNAAIRALFDAVGDAALTAPTEAAASILLVYGIAHKLQPGDRTFAAVAALLFATSSQLLITGMTSYSMTGHLVCNLAWLWLVLHDRPWSRVGAVVVTFIATGLHQLAFHPLFVAPFILWLAYQRRWGVMFFYAGALCAAALFWALYWPIALNLSGIEPQAAASMGGGFLIDRIIDMVTTAFNWISVVHTVDNLLRLITWQNPLVWPLFIVAATTLRRQPPIAVTLLGGILLIFAALLVVMPYQGHGWGYRYLHGLLGNFVLLAAFGWRTVFPRGEQDEKLIPQPLLLSVLVSLLVLLPIRALQAHAFASPYQRADQAISHMKADLVIVDATGRWYAQDLVRNDPFLTNRPIRIIADDAVMERAPTLCAHKHVALVHFASPEFAEIPVYGSPAEIRASQRRSEILRGYGCKG
jgi:hypothetical protein